MSAASHRRILVEVSGASANFELLERTAPGTAEALWDSLPISGEVTHARWAGSACWTKTDRLPLAQIRELEHQATSIYRGTLAVRPGKGGRAELFIAYGQAESRHERGRTYMTPVARVIGDAQALYDALARTWQEGSAPINIGRDNGGSHA